MFRWARNNWIKSDKKIPENLDLIQAYYEWYQKGYRIDLRKVKGHAGNGMKWQMVLLLERLLQVIIENENNIKIN